MKTPEEILNEMGPSALRYQKGIIAAMHEYAEQFKPKWIDVSVSMPPFDTLVLLRGVINWKRKDMVSYFSDIVLNDYEQLDYGQCGYLLKTNNDYLVVNHPNPEEITSEYITHWQPLTEVEPPETK